MRTGANKIALLAALLLFAALLSMACDDFRWHGAGGDSDIQAECSVDEAGCDGTWKTSCEGGLWVRITDCSDLDKMCEDGKCVWPETDGDEADGDLPDGDFFDNDSEHSDGDADTDGDFFEDDLDVENITDGDASDEIEADLTDGDDSEPDADSDFDESGDDDASDTDVSDTDLADNAEPDAEIEPEAEPEPDTETESDSEPDAEAYPPLVCADGICVDPATSFEWQQTPTGGTMMWEDAITHCEELDLDGGGWKLPNISELRTLVRGCADIETGGACGVKDVCGPCGIGTACLSYSSCCTSANCNPSSCADNGGPTGCYWPQQLSGTCSWYWSSSSFEDDPDAAWIVGFDEGYVSAIGKDNASHARCVR